jgi:hypothetical protein
MKTGILLPQTFAESVAKVKAFALQEFDRQIAKKQLYYHNREHIQQVQQRSDRIFQAIAPFWENAIGSKVTRMKLLLDLCVVAHDMTLIDEATTLEELVTFFQFDHCVNVLSKSGYATKAGYQIG